jgi:hypothetical protein
MKPTGAEKQRQNKCEKRGKGMAIKKQIEKEGGRAIKN